MFLCDNFYLGTNCLIYGVTCLPLKSKVAKQKVIAHKLTDKNI